MRRLLGAENVNKMKFMKKRILFLFCLSIILSVAKAQNINIPDTSFKAALIKQGFDKNNDGEIQFEETMIIDSLKIDSKKIKNLTGIEAFTNLNFLSCSGNQLTTFDVSKNIVLKTLWCSDNQLQTLDVSNNTALIELSCSHNQLKSIDLNTNTALAFLYCYNNSLTSINLTMNTALLKLYCSDNQLKSLDISKNPKLTMLYCFNNQIINLNLGKNIALLDLRCYNNQLTILDVSKNKNLVYLCCNRSPKLLKICVNKKQLKQRENIPGEYWAKDKWEKDDKASWTSDCE